MAIVRVLRAVIAKDRMIMARFLPRLQQGGATVSRTSWPSAASHSAVRLRCPGLQGSSSGLRLSRGSGRERRNSRGDQERGTDAADSRQEAMDMAFQN